jgi:hypothetical protein
MPEGTEKDLSVDDEQGEEVAGGAKRVMAQRVEIQDDALRVAAEKEI